MEHNVDSGVTSSSNSSSSSAPPEEECPCSGDCEDESSGYNGGGANSTDDIPFGSDPDNAVLSQLEKECQCCVDSQNVSECRKEAKMVVEAMAKSWEKNWGKGPGDDSQVGSDTVGGYFCWDWANGFANAAESVKSTIWGNAFERYVSTPPPQGVPVHYAVRIAIRNPKPRGTGTTCDGFVYDDGFMDGRRMVHGSCCKPNPAFPDPKSRYKVAAGSCNPADFEHYPIF